MPPTRTCYQLLNIKPNATLPQVGATFRRVVARYRPTLEVTGLFDDLRFKHYLNAYLTLSGEQRVKYDEALKQAGEGEVPLPAPLEAMTSAERVLLMARLAYWRGEPVEAVHLLRGLLEKQPQFAAGWAQMGETYFYVDKLEEGVQAYQRAVAADPNNAALAARLQEATLALAGRGHLKIEPTPEEELLQEERRQRVRITVPLALVGLAVVGYTFLRPAQPAGMLHLPWSTIITQAIGLFIFFIALSYGRVLAPFEKVMLWTSIGAAQRGAIRSYPYGLLLFVTAVPSLWLAVITLIILAAMDDDWPVSVIVLVGITALVTGGLTYLFYRAGTPWMATLLLGGNLPLLAGMIGWWFGSLGRTTED